MNNYYTQNNPSNALEALKWGVAIFLFTGSVLVAIYACGFALGA